MSFTLVTGGTCGSTVSPLTGRRSRLTTSFGISYQGYGIIVDNGYGVQNVVRFLEREKVKSVGMLQTHMHSDHVSGLPVNQMLFQKGKIQEILAPRLEHLDFGEVWERVFDKTNWPVRPENFGVTYHDKKKFGWFNPGGHFKLAGDTIRVSTLELNHPGGAVAYRFRADGLDLVIATDNELVGDAFVARFANFVSGTKMLVVDLQYTQDEYDGKVGISGGPAMGRVGWGHSTPNMYARSLALCEVGPERLIATHHHPLREEIEFNTTFLAEVDSKLPRFVRARKFEIARDGQLFY